MFSALSARKKIVNKNDFNIIIQQKILSLLESNFNKLAMPATSLKLFSKYHIKPKFLRSNLLVCMLQSTSYNNEASRDEQLIDYCAIIELLHIANKIHDSIDSLNKPNIYNLSLAQAILLGDLIFTIAFEQITALTDQNILQQFSLTTKNTAYYEAKLSEYQNLELYSIVDLIEQKQWPLYNNIITFLQQYSPVSPIITSILKNINSINVRSKLLSQGIAVNSVVFNYLYLNDAASIAIQETLANELKILTQQTQKSIEQHFNFDTNTTNHKIIDELKTLLTIASN